MTVEPYVTIATAAQRMGEHKVGCLVVTDNHGKIAGILSERDIIGKVVAASRNPEVVLVMDIMNRNVIACTLRTSIGKAKQIMASRGIRHLPVVDDGKLIGMISSRDLMAQELTTTQETLDKQRSVLTQLEHTNPGITELQTDQSGRILI